MDEHDVAKCENIVREFCKKAAQVIVQSRCAVESSTYGKPNKWFNLECEDIASLSNTVEELKADLYSSVIIDIFMVQDGSNTLLERWSVDFVKSAKKVDLAEIPIVYKMLVVLMRTLCIHTRNLPANRVHRQLASTTAAISYKVHTGLSSSQFNGEPLSVTMVPVDTPLGALGVSVKYIPSAAVSKARETNVQSSDVLIVDTELDENFFSAPAAPLRRRQTVSSPLEAGRQSSDPVFTPSLPASQPPTRSPQLLRKDGEGGRRPMRSGSLPAASTAVTAAAAARRHTATSSDVDGSETSSARATSPPTVSVVAIDAGAPPGSSSAQLPNSGARNIPARPTTTPSVPLYTAGSVEVHDGDNLWGPKNFSRVVTSPPVATPPFSGPSSTPTSFTPPKSLFSITPPFSTGGSSTSPQQSSAPKGFAFRVAPFKDGGGSSGTRPRSSSKGDSGITFEKIELGQKRNVAPSSLGPAWTSAASGVRSQEDAEAVRRFVKDMQQAPDELRSFASVRSSFSSDDGDGEEGAASSLHRTAGSTGTAGSGCFGGKSLRDISKDLDDIRAAHNALVYDTLPTASPPRNTPPSHPGSSPRSPRLF